MVGAAPSVSRCEVAGKRPCSSTTTRSVQEVQDGTVATGASVAIDKVFVTAVRISNLGNMLAFVQEPDGVTTGGHTYPQYAGVRVFFSGTELTQFPGLGAIQIGDCISLTGSTLEFMDDTELITPTAFALEPGLGSATMWGSTRAFVTPAAFSRSGSGSITGWPATSINGFGRVAVSGRIRLPRPAAITIAFTSSAPRGLWRIETVAGGGVVDHRIRREQRQRDGCIQCIGGSNQRIGFCNGNYFIGFFTDKSRFNPVFFIPCILQAMPRMDFTGT